MRAYRDAFEGLGEAVDPVDPVDPGDTLDAVDQGLEWEADGRDYRRDVIDDLQAEALFQVQMRAFLRLRELSAATGVLACMTAADWVDLCDRFTPMGSDTRRAMRLNQGRARWPPMLP